MSDAWFALLAVALFAVLVGALAPADGPAEPVGLIRICQRPDASLRHDAGQPRVLLPAGARFGLATVATGAAAPQPLEVHIPQPLSVRPARQACATVVARQIVATRALKAGEVLQPLRKLPGLNLTVVVASDFE